MGIATSRLLDRSSILHRSVIYYSSMATSQSMFQGKRDNYNGVVVKSREEPCERPIMEALLKESLKSWTNDGVRGVWFEVENEHAEWIPVLMQNGFSFHHAGPTLSVLLRWLPTEESCPIPPFAHTMVGIGGMVINEQKQVLLVQDKFHKKPHWKLPGGYVDPGESLQEAVKREVFEETGIQTEFISLLGVRHVQPQKKTGFRGVFECSDFYFVAFLKPVGSQEIKMCQRELRDAQWMDLQKFATDPVVFPLSQFMAQHMLRMLDPNDPVLPIVLKEIKSTISGADQQIYIVGDHKLPDISKL